jgi:hypothetical protein
MNIERVLLAIFVFGGIMGLFDCVLLYVNYVEDVHSVQMAFVVCLAIGSLMLSLFSFQILRTKWIKWKGGKK